MTLFAPVRFDVLLANLDPTIGAEIKKTRPCVVVSPDEMNARLRTVIVAPLTKTIRPYPSRSSIRFDGIDGQVALDQIRAIDKSRILKRLGAVGEKDREAIVGTLQELFAW